MGTIDVDLNALDQAATIELPAKAGEFAGRETDGPFATGRLIRQASLAGNPVICDDLTVIAEEISWHLHRMASTFARSGEALGLLADRLAGQDGDVADRFRTMGGGGRSRVQ